MNKVLLTAYVVQVVPWVLLLILLCILLCSCISLKKLKQSAYTDPVTGGLTELGFYVRGRYLVSGRITVFSVVSMQIVELQHISQIYGPAEYRRFLKYLHGVLKIQLGGDELIVRTSEDTFIFLIQNRRPNEICAKLDNICDSFNRFNEGQKNTHYLKPFFGIYLPESDDEDIKDIGQKAVISRTLIPDGRRYNFYDREYAEKNARDHETALSMIGALRGGEFIVYFQPKIRVSDQQVVGAEALIRWRHPQRGIISPDMFLSVAEQYHMIEQIDRFVFGEVCRTLARWQKQKRELCPISVNLSEADINRPNLVDECNDICNLYDVPPAQIEFEMKEEIILKNPEKIRVLIERMHFYGFRCAIDNFGSSLCSLKLLGTLGIDTVKLDRSFFAGENNNRHGRYLIETILKLAAQMHIRTVAEGIDSHGQVKYLRQAACDMIQGFYFFKPMPLEKFESEVYDNGTLKNIVNDRDSDEESGRKEDSVGKNSLRLAKSIILFSYRPADDSVEFSDIFSPVLGNQKVFKNALALFRTTDLIHENDRNDFIKLLEYCQREDGWCENTLRFYMTHGRYEWLEVRVHQDDHNGGFVSGMLADMSGWKNEVNRWKEKAARDALTGLYNREHFEQSVESVLRHGEHSCAALIFVDVDDFKYVNDTFGHMFGDDVLCFVAKQTLGVFRYTDIIARYGGDEFVVFAPSLKRDILEDRLKKLLSTFRYPYRSGTVEYKISVTLGASLYPVDGADYETLLNNADCALYEAKKRGKNRYVLYEPHMKGKTTHNISPIVADPNSL